MRMPNQIDDRLLMQLVHAANVAASFLKDKCDHDGWQWSWNFVREYVRCSTGLRFTNSKSPQVYRALVHHYPQWKPYVANLKPLKNCKQGKLF